ncbi:hypothetical protein CBP35_06945 [Acidovorax carolinensis]|nr:hypothetical protein [Acidovorax carolinensis]ART54829.1 hypothetical protein CBP35_06945 [Acidovorax carolinensis]
MEAAGNALAEMTPGDAAISLADFTAIFMHRIAPVARVLDVALCELIAQRRQREGLSHGL